MTVGEPVGVRIVRPDGTVLPVELLHLGVDRDGIDRWEIAGAVFNPDSDDVRIDALPGCTSLSFKASSEPCGEFTYDDEDGNRRSAPFTRSPRRRKWWRRLII